MIRIAIVEDEQLFREKILRYLHRYEEKNKQSFSVKTFENGMQFLTDYHPEYDIIFMDIEMPYLNGMETAKRIRKVDSRTAIAFITNMANYAVQGYEVEAIDFIVKPFTYEVFEYKLGRILSRTEDKREKSSIIVKSDNLVHNIRITKLRYVEISGHTLIYHMEKEQLEMRGSMREAEQLLEGHGFCKCSQSYLVNLRFITRIEANDVYLGDFAIPISRGRKKDVVRAMSDFMARL